MRIGAVAHLSERRSRKSANPIQFPGADATVPRSIAHPASPSSPDSCISGRRSRETERPTCSTARCHRPLWAIRSAPRPRPPPPEGTPRTSCSILWGQSFIARTRNTTHAQQSHTDLLRRRFGRVTYVPALTAFLFGNKMADADHALSR